MLQGRIFLLFLSSFLVLNVINAQTKGSHKIASKLLGSLDQRSNEIIHFHTILTDQVDLDAYENYFNLTSLPYPERAKTLLKALQQKAIETQGPLLDFLSNHPDVIKESIRPHWITNVISMKANAKVIKELAARDDVFWLGENVTLAQTSYETVASSNFAPDDVENGLIAINAPAMWALGYTGYGTKIFTADTGVDPTHPAISHQYHGNYFPESHSWYPNPFVPGQAERGPFDCSNHGTHVTGTVLGLDRTQNDTIGVAFNATWMGGAILCGVGTEDNIGAFEWAVDPDGDADTSTDIPDVINNSWYDPSLDSLDCYSVYVPILQTLELIGVAVVFSAGNEGPDPGTITQPHNININEVNAFTVGALNGNTPALPIATFSSRGPSHCPGEGSIKIKPEVSAPGVQVRSCVPGNDYALLNGTSMAAPHVSGAILLLKEAFPYLGAKELKTALYHSCTDLGDEGEDNFYGMGIINVYAAYQYLINLGNIPVNPVKSKDVILLEVKHAEMGCDARINPTVFIENAGMDTIRQLLIKYGTDSLQNEYVWEGMILPKNRTYIQLPEFKPGLGFVNMLVEIEKINGGVDEKPLNNTKHLAITITTRESVSFEFELSNNLCKKADFILTSPLGPTGNHETNWYTDLFDGELARQGNMLFIPVDSLEKELYAEIVYQEQIGPAQADLNNGNFENIKNSGLVFDAFADIIIKSFDITSQQKHNGEFVIINEEGTIIHSTTRPNIAEGQRTIVVNWTIPKGKNYRLLKKVGRGLWTQKEGVTYPYTIPNIVTFTSGIAADTLYPDYKNFFNIAIQYVEPCGRIPFVFNVREDSILVKADFEISRDTLRLPQENILTGRSLVSGTAQILWDMGDGTEYNEPEIMHEYLDPGIFTLCFHVVDTNECFTAGIRQINVFQSTSSEEVGTSSEQNVPWIYPNPANQYMTLARESGGICLSCPVKIFDGHGIEIATSTWNDESSLSIDIQSWPTGLYVVKVFQPASVVSLKFIKL